MSENHWLFFGRLPPDLTGDILFDLIQQNTDVEPSAIKMKRGFAFAKLPTEESAERTVTVLNGYNVMGSNILVEPSMAQNRRNKSRSLQINNIPERYPWEEFHRLLTSFGNVEHYEKGVCKPDGSYGMTVTYESVEQAQQAHVQLSNYELTTGVFLKVDFVVQNRNNHFNKGFRGPRNNNIPDGPQQGPYGQSIPHQGRPADFPLRILVLSDMVGAIIGRGGGTIRQITQQSRARVDVHRKENAGSPEKVITIYGNPDSCSTACHKILEVMQQESNSQNRGEIPLKILAHNNLIGRIIGKNGTTIKRIMEQSETRVAVSSSIHDVNSFYVERVITVKGTLDNISKAEQMISAKLKQSYENDWMAMTSQQVLLPGFHSMPMMHAFGPPPNNFPPQRAGPPLSPYNNNNMYSSPYMPYCNNSTPPPPQQSLDFQKETVFVFIPNSAVGAIIGTGGSSIRDMISASNASIKVAQTSKDEAPDKSGERKVTVIATPEGQWKAQYMIFKKVNFEGFNASPDYLLKVEILIPSNQVGRIIGKGGQTIREIQRLSRAIVKFPESQQNAECEESPVQITGDFYSSQAAQRHIRSLVHRNLWSMQQQQQQQLRRRSSPSTGQDVAAAVIGQSPPPN